jgi:hypothetical protein
LGFIIGAIAAIGVAYVMFSDNAKQAETAQSFLNKTQRGLKYREPTDSKHENSGCYSSR